jgi:predicted  nucleic acid-binding Zn-ribbon protein
MAPPEAEWMLWAKRLRDENKVLLQRIDAKPESSAMDLLAEEVRNLAGTIQHLQRDNQALRERVQELERDAVDRKQMMGDEFKGLERAMAEMKDELSRTVELVQTLRKEGLYQTQIQTTTPCAAARIIYRTRAGEA